MSLRLAPFFVWLAHASLSYAIVAVHCHLQVLHENVFGATTGRVLLFVVTLLALGAALAVAAVSYAVARDPDPNGRRTFTAGFTGLANGLVILYLLWAFVLDAVIDLC